MLRSISLTFQSDPEATKLIHEAYQFLIAKKKKKSMRSMAENWGKIGGKALVLNVNNINSSQTQEMEKQGL